jgi:hypothetical protein
MWKEFKEFTSRGSVLDLAIGASLALPLVQSSPRSSTTLSCRLSACSPAGLTSSTCSSP